MTNKSADIRVGISGWRYTPWRGTFYPKGLLQKNELHFASRTVNSIEINGSFYALQSPKSYQAWYADTPENFVFSVKAPRFITHIKRLRDVQEPIANFFASGVLQLKEKLGPILWQFPPSFKFDKEKFENFLKLLPRDTFAAADCAKHCNPDQKNIDWETPPKKSRLRYSVEIRNESFRNEEFVDLLRKYKIALVVADTAGRWPQMEDITSNFVYMRLHGDAELYRSGYSDAALERWYQRMKAWSEGNQPDDAKLINSPKDNTEAAPKKDSDSTKSSRDVFCYFDNTDKLWAPYDARKILEKFNLADKLEEEPGKLPKDIKKPTEKKKPEEDKKQASLAF